jgi:hypothetical protein
LRKFPLLEFWWNQKVEINFDLIAIVFHLHASIQKFFEAFPANSVDWHFAVDVLLSQTASFLQQPHGFTLVSLRTYRNVKWNIFEVISFMHELWKLVE